MHKANFIQLQSHLPYYQHIEDVKLSVVNMEAALKVFTESVKDYWIENVFIHCENGNGWEVYRGIKIKVPRWCTIKTTLWSIAI